MKRIMILLALCFSLFSISIVSAETYWYEDWESGWDNWYASNGIWEIGAPGSPGPDIPRGGLNCAATMLTSDYPNYADSKLISTPITIPAANENPRLILYHWYYLRVNNADYAYIQLLIDDNWVTIYGPIINYSLSWTRLEIDLTPYAGIETRLAFYFTSNSSRVEPGWYIDDVSIIRNEFPEFEIDVVESFEDTISEWYSDPGHWEIGIPESPGPDQAFDGLRCIGTVMNSNYPNNCNSRFISPPFEIPFITINAKIEFWHWHYLRENDDDYGYVQMKNVHPDSEWISIAGPFMNISPTWTRYTTSLNEFIGQRVRLAFLLVSDNSNVRRGWYIDSLIVNVDTLTAIAEIPRPNKYAISQNYPNPFNASTLISYELPNQSDIRIEIYDILGSKVTTLQDGIQPAGNYQVIWRPEELSSGVYFYRLQADDYTESKRMILVK